MRNEIERPFASLSLDTNSGSGVHKQIRHVVSLFAEVHRGSPDAFQLQENRLNLSIAKQHLDDTLSLISDNETREEVISELRKYKSMQSQIGSLYFLEWTKKLQSSLHGETHIELARTLNQIGNTYFRMGTVIDLRRAESAFQESLRIKRAVFGDVDHIEIATSINNIALIFKERGEYDRALELFRKSLKIKRATVGDKSPDMAVTIVNIAKIYELKGDLGKALELYEATLPFQKIGPLDQNHPNTAVTKSNIANIYKKQGKLNEAVVYFTEALATMKSVDPNHPVVHINLCKLGKIFYKTGDIERAQRCFKDALAAQQRTMPENHPTVMKTKKLARLTSEQ